jgi:hypothetical protein
MKLNLLSFVILILICQFILVSNLFAQEEPLPSKKNVLKLDIVWILGEAFNFSYERVLTDESSLQFGVIFGNGGGLGTVSYRYYLSDTPAPKGVHISPMVGLGSMENFGFIGGLMIGKQGYFKQKITLDAFIGPAYLTGDGDGAFTLFGGVTVGLAF